jgi:hypothetical protein
MRSVVDDCPDLSAEHTASIIRVVIIVCVGTELVGEKWICRLYWKFGENVGDPKRLNTCSVRRVNPKKTTK